MGLISKDPTDIRDLQLAELQPEKVELPEEYCLIDKMTLVQSQFWGTCTSHSADGLKEYQDKQEYNREIKLSQRFIYRMTKELSGLWHMQGDYLRTAVKVLQKYGACLEDTFPDTRDKTWKNYISKKPSAIAFKEAEKYKIKSYWAVNTDDLRNLRQACYRNKSPICVGSPWYKNQNKTQKDGRLLLPGGEMSGGHAYLYVGWTQGKDWFRNSWGAKWGKGGYFYIAENDFKHFDFWNGWVGLDLEVPDIKTQGWVAERHIKHVDEPGFKSGDKIIPETGLRLRSSPTIYASIVKRLTSNMKGEIISNERKKANGYFWRRVTINS